MKSLFIFFTGMPLGYAISEAIKIGNNTIIISCCVAVVGWLSYITYMANGLSKIQKELQYLKEIIKMLKGSRA